MSDSEKIAQLRSARADYEDELRWHRFILDSYAGTGGFAGAVKPTAISFYGWAAEAYTAHANVHGQAFNADSPDGSYLDQFPREEAEKYKQRCKLAHYTNYVAPIGDLLCSYVSKEQVAREGVDDTKLGAWVENVNTRGTSWDDLKREIITIRCALLGWMPVLVDAPPLPGDVTNAAQAQGLDTMPRAIPLFPVNLLDWSCNEAGVFTWAKIRTTHVEHPDPMLPAVDVERIAIWFVDRVDVYRITKHESGERLEGPEPFTHKFGRVPVEIFRHKASPDDPVRGIPMLHDVAVAARRVFNLESELDEHIRSCVFAILGLPMDDTTQDVQSAVLGNGSILKIPMKSNQTLQYVAPPATVAATLETRIEKGEKAIYRMARVEYSKPTGSAQSGASKAYEFEQTNRRLGDFAAQLARSEERLLKLVATALSMGTEQVEGVRVTAPTSFRVEDLSTDLENALLAIKIKLGPEAEMQLRVRLVDKILPNLSRESRDKVMAELEKLSKEPPPEAPATGEEPDSEEPDDEDTTDDIAA